MNEESDTAAHPAAVITGAASGIGRTTARHFADNGYAVVVVDVDTAPRTARTAEEPFSKDVESGDEIDTIPTHELIEEQGGDATYIDTDVTDWHAVQDMVDQVIDTYGRIDVMINNAGYVERAPIDELPVEDAHRMFRINIDGVYHGMKAVVPPMKQQGRGTIVNISSGAGKTGIPNLAAYCGSKFAVIGMTEAVAREVSGHGITVNAVCPGRTQTAMTDFEGVPPEKVAATIYDVSQAQYTGRAVDV